MLADWLSHMFDQTDDFVATISTILESNAELSELVRTEHVSTA